MSKRNLTILLLLIAAAVAALLLLNPCGAGIVNSRLGKTAQSDALIPPANNSKLAVTDNVKADKKTIEPMDKSTPVEKNVPPRPAEIDTAPPVTLSASEEIPNVARCAIANFPAEAKPHVKIAIVTVRLIVDKFGNVRSDTPISVEFPQEVDEEVLPAMRKLFIKAGSQAFGAKKCPPHVVNGQNVGYAIEVPLQYKH